MTRRWLVGVVAVVVLAAVALPVAWVNSTRPSYLIVDAMPGAEPGGVRGRMAQVLASTAIATWRRCPVEDTAPESVIGFVINGNLVPPVADSRERVHELLVHLVDAGCDVNARSMMGKTPLMNAAMFGDVWAVQTLLSMKADPSLKSRADDQSLRAHNPEASQRRLGLTALDIARMAAARPRQPGADHQGVIALLENGSP